ncbi:M14 family metallopeptidase [Flavobacterium sp. '19STA2R22 D10 B1']|uniref:M14 family metallopeptidase n=1 Tax=Flavobacterium aerium TaxID=3037261 RepID=UPI00278C04ED|nr:M14 family metallopeptidase [Flavobacterium sp. '19STA2R22 D10 B1']
MKSALSIFIYFILFTMNAQDNMTYLTPYEKGNGNQTATYEETIAYFQLLAKNFPSIQIQEMGLTDSGEPLHLVIFNPDQNFDFEAIQKNKAIYLINNGIHPGEPDGIDATMLLFRDLALHKIDIPKNTVLVNIPIYNIGGALNRNAHSRTNQNGPELYGFRGNARNYDLNRDFIKCDTRNARSFAQIFQKVKPDVFLDNHVSNGANYQYTLTYIATQHQQLGGKVGEYFHKEMMPTVLKDLQKKKIEATPYVNVFNKKPDEGFEEMLDLPRYSTGYASLFNTFSSMVETHMLKNYSDRVKVTYEYMISTLKFIEKNHSKIKELRKQQWANYAVGTSYPIEWKLDATKFTKFPFLGYEGGYKKSEITGKDRLFYDDQKPFRKDIPYYNEYVVNKRITIPEAYIIPKAWWNVIDILKANNIIYKTLTEDTLIEVESYRIEDFQTSKSAFEGHYMHSKTKLSVKKEKHVFKKGDLWIPTQQYGVRYLLATLEPEASDSFFNWNFFDAILQQKEHYSDYVFEDLAIQILKDNPTLKKAFDVKKSSDVKFADDAEAQLDWIYQNSDHYEKSHMQYPVYRVL